MKCDICPSEAIVLWNRDADCDLALCQMCNGSPNFVEGTREWLEAEVPADPTKKRFPERGDRVRARHSIDGLTAGNEYIVRGSGYGGQYLYLDGSEKAYDAWNFEPLEEKPHDPANVFAFGLDGGKIYEEEGK